jgi:hypothetical protein
MRRSFARAKSQVPSQVQPKHIHSIKQEVINHLFIIDIYTLDDDGNINLDLHNFTKETRYFIYKPANNIIRKAIEDHFFNESRTIYDLNESYTKQDTTQYNIIKLLKLYGYFRESDYSVDTQNDILSDYSDLMEQNESDTSEESISEFYIIDRQTEQIFDQSKFVLSSIGKIKEVNQFKLFRKGAFRVHHIPYFMEHRKDNRPCSDSDSTSDSESDSDSESEKEEEDKKEESDKVNKGE